MVILFVLLQAPYRIGAQSWPGTMTGQCRWVGTVGKRKITGTAEGVLQWVGDGGGKGVKLWIHNEYGRTLHRSL